MTWNNLSMSDKARIMQLAVKDGITDLRNIISTYEYATGGQIPPTTYEEEPEFNGPAIPSNMYNGPEVPYGFYDEPIDWERKKALQHYAESGFKANQVSQAGAMGPYQIMPKNWAAYSKKLGLTGSAQDYNNSEAVRDKMMDELLNAKWVNKGFPSDSVRTAKALMGYNWGSGNATKFLEEMKKQGVDIYHSMDWIDKIPNSETRNYVNYILRERNITGKTIADFEKALPHRFDAYPEVKKLQGGGPTGVSIINPKLIRTAAKNAVLSLLPKKVSKGLASIASLSQGDPFGAPLKDYYQYGVQEDWNPEEGFLMSPNNQQKYMEEIGYHKVNDGSYGMVNKAATHLRNLLGADIPIYQLGEDDISPDKVTLVSTKPEEVRPYFERLIDSGRLLRDPGTHPSALYQDKEGNYYLKSWDLNDYGQHGQKSGGTTYGGLRQIMAEIYDYVGTPFVQRTGLIKVPTEEEMPVYDKSRQSTEEYFRKILERIDNGEFALGGKIHIKPSHRGKFTALKKRTGKSASWFKTHGTPAQRKMATFEINARNWKHGDGGLLTNIDGFSF